MPEEVAIKAARSWMKSVAFSQLLMQPVLPSGGDAEGEEVPQMPVCSANPSHSSRSDRDKHSDGGGLLSSLLLSVQMVVTVLTKQEIANSPKARQAMKDEYYGLQNAGTWDLSRVSPKWQVKKKAQDDGRVVHFARVFGICSETVSYTHLTLPTIYSV